MYRTAADAQGDALMLIYLNLICHTYEKEVLSCSYILNIVAFRVLK